MKYLLFLILSFNLFAQSELLTLFGDENPCPACILYETFSDGNYTGWTVSNGSFTVDNLVVNPLSANQYSLKATTAGGNNYIYISSTQSYGTWEFDYYRSTDGGGAFYFISSNETATNHYSVAPASTGRVQFQENASNSWYTNTNYQAVSTWYTYRIVRNGSNQFSTYIKGGAYTDFTLVDCTGGFGTNPNTDATITTSAYLVIKMFLNNRVSNIKVYP